MRILGNTFKDDLNLFLKNNALWICLVLVAIIIATIVIIFVVKNRKKNDKTFKGNEWIDALGGKENIVDVTAMGSRLNVTLKNQDLIQREVLTSLGVSNIMIMSSKVTLIIEDKAEKIASIITKAIKD